MTREDTIIDIFLRDNIFESYDRTPIIGDASTKTFERIKCKSRRMLLCKVPDNDTSVLEKMLHINQALKLMNLRVPIVYAMDRKKNMSLIEDFGDNSYATFLARNRCSELHLYKVALDTLLYMQENWDNLPIIIKDTLDIPIYGDELMLQEALGVIDYYVPFETGKEVSKVDRDAFIDLWKDFMEPLKSYKKKGVLCIRDYHSPNLFWLKNEKGIQRVGIIDYDDAMIGHPAYDVVSLLQDARREMSHSNREALFNYYFDRCHNDYDRNSKIECWTLGIQRACKVLGFASYRKTYMNEDKYLPLIKIARYNMRYNLDRIGSHGKPIVNCLEKLGAVF